MTEFEREEAVFRAALAEEAERPVVGDLPAGWVDAARRTTRWRRRGLLAAAAAVVLLAGALLVVDVSRGSGPEPADGAQGWWEQDGRTAGALPPRDGWRWVSRGGVSVQVPQDWVTTSLMCGNAWDGGPPAVATVGAYDYATVADCANVPPPSDVEADALTKAAFPPVATSSWRTLLVLEEVGTVYDGQHLEVEVPDGTYTYEGWTLRRETHGDVVVVMLSDEAHAPLAREVVDGVVEGTVSAEGCRAEEELDDPRGEPVRDEPLHETAPEAMTLCSYGDWPRSTEAGSTARPLAEVRRTGPAEAAAVASAVRAAPVVTVPPSTCSAEQDYLWTQDVVLRLFDPTGVVDVEVRAWSCVVEVGGELRRLTDELTAQIAGLEQPAAPSGG